MLMATYINPHNVTRLVLAESVPHGPGVPVEVPHRRANPAEEGSQVVWGAPHLGLHLLHPLLQPLVQHRVVKCLGYDGYIRVKISSGWGKKFGRTHNFAKSGLFLVRFVQLCKIVVHRLAQFNRVVNIPTPKPFLFLFCLIKVTKLSRFMPLFWGKIWLDEFAPCK